MTDPTVHASCVLIGDAAVLIRGDSGSGKSRLARQVLLRAADQRLFARLIGDDRIRLSQHHGRIIARGHPDIAGRIEARGLGILGLPHEPAGVVRLVVDCLAAQGPRYPEPDTLRCTILGIDLPRLGLRIEAESADLVLLRLRVTDDTLMTE